MKDLSKPGTICIKSESVEAFQSLGATLINYNFSTKEQKLLGR